MASVLGRLRRPDRPRSTASHAQRGAVAAPDARAQPRHPKRVRTAWIEDYVRATAGPDEDEDVVLDAAAVAEWLKDAERTRDAAAPPDTPEQPAAQLDQLRRGSPRVLKRPLAPWSGSATRLIGSWVLQITAMVIKVVHRSSIELWSRRPGQPLDAARINRAGWRADAPYAWIVASRASCMAYTANWCGRRPGGPPVQLRRRRAEQADTGRRPHRVGHERHRGVPGLAVVAVVVALAVLDVTRQLAGPAPPLSPYRVTRSATSATATVPPNQRHWSRAWARSPSVAGRPRRLAARPGRGPPPRPRPAPTSPSTPRGTGRRAGG